uniref:HNH endonuclease signature motif containing protein n=2 Tax=uncultured Nocardioides sp. TaxID=198441 RepID=UPI0026339044
TVETLAGGLAAATLDTGDRIAAHTARRLACEAGIIPVVLGGRREVLDQGRRKRLFTRAQRIALATRDRGCTAAGCHTAAWFCHAHHDHPWATGGTTDLTNGRLLCPTHHRAAHDPRYKTRVLADHQIEFTLRC